MNKADIAVFNIFSHFDNYFYVSFFYYRMKPITFNEISTLKNAKQNFCDCYLVSAISALAQTKNGKNILKENILRNGKNYCIKFNNVNGNSERYLVKNSEQDMLILTDRFLEPVPLKVPDNPIIKAIEIAMSKLLTIHPDKKPFICRIPKCQENFEYNKVSNFFKMFTGIHPITINESGFRMSLKKNRKIVINLLKRMEEEKDFSFVIGSGYRGLFNDLPHCYTVKSVYDGKINLYDNRKQIYATYKIDDAIKRFKYICGYFNNNLKSEI